MVRRWSNLSSNFTFLSTPYLTTTQPCFKASKFNVDFKLPPQTSNSLPVKLRHNIKLSSRTRLWLRKSAWSRPALLSHIDSFRRSYSKTANSFILYHVYFISTYWKVPLPKPQYLTFCNSSSGNAVVLNVFDLKITRTWDSALLFLQQSNSIPIPINLHKTHADAFYLEFLKFTLKSSKLKLVSLTPMFILNLRRSLSFIRMHEFSRDTPLRFLLSTGLTNDFFLKARSGKAYSARERSNNLIGLNYFKQISSTAYFSILQPLYLALIRLIYFKNFKGL